MTVSLQKGGIQTQTHVKEGHVKTHKEIPREARERLHRCSCRLRPPPEAGKGQGRVRPVSEGLGIGHQNCGSMDLCRLKPPPSSWHFVYGSPSKLVPLTSSLGGQWGSNQQALPQQRHPATCPSLVVTWPLGSWSLQRLVRWETREGPSSLPGASFSPPPGGPSRTGYVCKAAAHRASLDKPGHHFSV